MTEEMAPVLAPVSVSQEGEKLLSIVVTIPVYNEAPRLGRNVEVLLNSLRSNGHQSRIIIAEDGSRDGSREVAEALRARNGQIEVVHNDSRLGRGEAIRRAWNNANGDIFVFMDADLATDLRYLPTLLEMISSGRYDFVTGSRYAPGSRSSRPMLRRAVSLAYNRIVRIVFHTEITDHQCGFRAFNLRAREAVLQLTTENTWAWDTECIVLLRRLGMRLGELPVSWEEKKTRNTRVSRLIGDVFVHGLALLRMYPRLRSSTSRFEK